MRTHKQWIAGLTLLLLPSLLWSAETPSPLFETTPPIAKADTASESAREIRIFTLEYQKADGLARIIGDVVSDQEAKIAADRVSQSLIVATSPDRMQQIERVIRELDVTPFDEANVAQILYRVYMVELPSKLEAMKPFSLMVTSPSGLSGMDLVNAVERANIQLTEFDIASHGVAQSGEQTWKCLIEGRAASPEAIQRLMELIPALQMQRLSWEHETAAVPAAQNIQLPPQVAQQIDRLLGAEARTVGYWFGNLSAPGKIEAPIGPWVFVMNVNTTTTANEVELEVVVVRESQDNPSKTWQILSNSMRANLFKPVIIGYNRDNFGTRTMGALVIVPTEQ